MGTLERFYLRNKDQIVLPIIVFGILFTFTCTLCRSVMITFMGGPVAPFTGILGSPAGDGLWRGLSFVAFAAMVATPFYIIAQDGYYKFFRVLLIGILIWAGLDFLLAWKDLFGPGTRLPSWDRTFVFFNLAISFFILGTSAFISYHFMQVEKTQIENRR